MACRHLSQLQSEALALNNFSSKTYDVYASMVEPSTELFWEYFGFQLVFNSVDIPLFFY